LRANREDVREDRFAFGMRKRRAMRHCVYDPRPLFGLIPPNRRQRVTFEAAMGKQAPSFLHDGKIDISRRNRRWRRIITRPLA
jgi:hypothetical protein